MGPYRWPLFIGALAVSILVSVALSIWLNAWAFLGLLLFLPFLPRLARARQPDTRRPPACPRCGYEARGPDEAYCPRDGAALAQR